jgi:1,4-alpha-glucan branching enzyme
MIRTQPIDTTERTVKVTFALPDQGVPVSVVGDFNQWNPHAHPLRKRSNGTRSAAITIPVGSTVRFRYLADGGVFFDDDQGVIEPNGQGQTHTLLSV